MDGKGWIGQVIDGQTEGLMDGQMGGDINTWMPLEKILPCKNPVRAL